MPTLLDSYAVYCRLAAAAENQTSIEQKIRAALIKLTIVLPRHTAPGKYLVAITRDQNGNGVVAEGLAATSEAGGQQQITANLDLRSAKAGQYFLSTTHEQDQAAYYYPLQIK